MNQGGIGWDQHLLLQLFSPTEIQAINRTPISKMGYTDKLFWSFSNSVQYSVKSGYKVARICFEKAKRGEGPSAGRKEEDRNMWTGIWKLNIKKKIQHFLWRACHNRLLVSSNLKKRGIELDKVCKLCGEGKETADHLFFKCSKAQTTWKLAPIRWESFDQHTTSVEDWWRALENTGNSEELTVRKEFSAYMLWHIWKNRN